MQPKCVHKCQHMHTYAVHNHQGYLESAHSVCCFILPLSNSLTLLCMYVCVCVVKCMGLLIFSSCVEGIVGR